MKSVKLAAAAAFLAALPGLALSASAQAPVRAPEQIVLITGESTAPYTVVGTVNAEYHQKSVFAKTSARDEVNKQLRAAASKLGADAVVKIAYQDNSPMMSKKGFLAKGTAIKFNTPAPAEIVATPPVQAIGPLPPPPAVVASAAPVVPAPLAAAPAAPTPAGVIALSEGDVANGRAYAVLGAISASAAPNLDKTPRQVLDEDFRSRANAMGADAVIMIRYDATGASAQGVAVKYK